MKTQILILMQLFITVAINAQELAWVRTAGSNSGDNSQCVVTDLDGNIYIAGSFPNEGIVFGQDTLMSHGGLDAFITKYDKNGNVIWAKGAGGFQMDQGYGVATDLLGNIYFTGAFSSSSISFGSYTLTNTSGDNDIFLVKYDSNGNVIWAKKMGGSLADYGQSVCTDTDGNIFLTGFFESSTISFGSTTLTKSGGVDVFIAKFNSSGTALWAKRAGGNLYDYGYSVSTDAIGNAFITGRFESTSITFGTTTLTNHGGFDVFLTKYDSNGNVLWAKGGGSNTSETSKSVCTDALGNVFIAGSFDGNIINFDSLTLQDTIFTNGTNCMFLIKYDNNGNILWGRNAIGKSEGNSVSTDKVGNIFVTGVHLSNVEFGSFPLTNYGGNDLFIVKYNAIGNVLWAKNAIGNMPDLGRSVSTDKVGNVYLFGDFSSTTLTFDANTIFNKGSTDLYLVKISQDCPNFNVNAFASNSSCYTCSNGSVSAIATGGTQPYSYIWYTPEGHNTDSVTGLISGNYFVYATDSNGCVAFDSVKVLIGNCSSHFILYPDTTTPHYYFAINQAIGVQPISHFWSWGDGSLDTIPYPSHTYATTGFYNICLTIIDSVGCTSTYCDSVNLAKSPSAISHVTVISNIVNGVKEISSYKVSIFPIPASDKIEISGLNNGLIEIFDIHGQLISSNEILNASHIIEITKFKSGIYIMKIKNDNRIIIKKFIKQ